MKKIIKSETEYNAVLERIEHIFDAKFNSSEGDELELLLLLVKDYENKYHPVPAPDAIEAIKLTLQEKSLKAKDLMPFIGSKGYISQILTRKRPLTASMMQQLHKHLGIPAEVLLAI
jgi:HTH-type transcriptional regulator / antitoxin HigA